MKRALQTRSRPLGCLRAGVRALFLGMGLLCGAWAQAQNAMGDGPQHERQLQAIRQALLEATLGTTPTQVLSTAWIDARGALHESHEFQSRAEIRGVRVLSYLNDGEEPKARVSAEVLPWGWRQRQTAQCESPPRAWRLPMAVAVRLDSGMPGPQRAAAQAMLTSAHSSWSQWIQRSERWTLASWTAPPASTYLRALLSPSNEDHRRWFATLTLRPAPAPASGWLEDPSAQWHWALEVQISQRQSQQGEFQPVARQSFSIAVDVQALAQAPVVALQSLHARLQQDLSQWMAEFDARTRCEPVQFVVSKEGPASLRLLAGAGSGLRSGDRVLLMQPGWVPSRMLDPRSIEQLVLAEVVQIGQRHTDIRQLAGPPLAAQGEWVAMPL